MDIGLSIWRQASPAQQKHLCFLTLEYLSQMPYWRSVEPRTDNYEQAMLSTFASKLSCELVLWHSSSCFIINVTRHYVKSQACFSFLLLASEVSMDCLGTPNRFDNKVTYYQKGLRRIKVMSVDDDRLWSYDTMIAGYDRETSHLLKATLRQLACQLSLGRCKARISLHCSGLCKHMDWTACTSEWQTDEATKLTKWNEADEVEEANITGAITLWLWL